MASVNASRDGLNQTVTNAVSDARIIGFNSDGLACVWSGGYTFNVYDAARQWGEVRAFTSGDLAGVTDYTSKKSYQMAKDRMESEGFDIVQ